MNLFLLRNEWSHTLKGRRWNKQWETAVEDGLCQGRDSLHVSVLHCSMGLKEAMTSCSAPWSLCMGAGRGVSQEEQLTENTFMGREKPTSFFTSLTPLPSQTPSWLFLQALSLSVLLQGLVCQTRKSKFMKELCHLHHSLSSLGATACHFIYLGNCIGNGRNYHFIFEFPGKSRLHLAEVVWGK